MTLSISSAEIVRDLQCVLGLVAIYLLYDTLRALGVRSKVAFIAVLFFSITTPVCAAEMAMLYAVIIRVLAFAGSLALRENDAAL